MSNRGWIGVDLDGTLAHYDEWRGPTHIGAPVPEMVERVKRWLAAGHTVKIFTARVSHEPQADEVRRAIAEWLVKHEIGLLEVTCTKDFAMIELWDDRCVQVEPNTGRPVAQSTRGLT